MSSSSIGPFVSGAFLNVLHGLLHVLEGLLKDREEDVIRRIEAGARVDGNASVITRRRQSISWLTIVKRELGTKAIEEAKNSWPMTFSKELRVA